MKRVWGAILVALALTIAILFAYDLLSSTEKVSAPTFTVFVLPLVLFISGYFDLKKKPDIPTHDLLRNDSETNLNELAFDQCKREVLVEKLNKLVGEKLILSSEFFDGNYDDQGSIGCNLYPEHPGINVFRDVFFELSNREDVSAIYVHVSEVEPDAESWPYADRVYIFGDITLNDVRQLTKQIAPTEISEVQSSFSSISQQVRVLNSKPLKVLWWD